MYSSPSQWAQARGLKPLFFISSFQVSPPEVWYRRWSGMHLWTAGRATPTNLPGKVGARAGTVPVTRTVTVSEPRSQAGPPGARGRSDHDRTNLPMTRPSDSDAVTDFKVPVKSRAIAGHGGGTRKPPRR
jgi:hypothetical protein